MKRYDLLVIGGGAAGMGAALAAEAAGLRSVLLVEREAALGGILLQCIHHGFGHGYFGEDLTGVEYAQRFCRCMARSKIQIQTETTVLRLSPGRTALLAGAQGVTQVAFTRCVLAVGCRERTIGMLPVAGSRPAGIFTAGTAQKLVNLGHYDIGHEIVILGSGDIGQIMARRLTLLGRHVIALVEQRPALGGLQRNQRECIAAYRIPVLLNATVDEVVGTGRICGVMVRHLEDGRREYVPCDTLITSVGLLPDQDLIAPLRQEGKLPEWLSVCGNCDYVHEIVDSVTMQAETLGKALAGEISGQGAGAERKN